MSLNPKLAFDVCHDVYVSIRADLEGIPLIDPTKVPSDHLWRSHKAPTGAEFVADFAIACRRALEGPESASRLILCQSYYLQAQPYEKVRKLLGLGEIIWTIRTDEIRSKVGALLIERGLFPPKKYFGERCGPRKAKRKVVPIKCLVYENATRADFIDSTKWGRVAYDPNIVEGGVIVELP